MIVKMKFVNISGPRNDIDRVTDLYLSRYEIQLESALSELKTVDNLRPFMEINPYRDVLKKAEEYVGYLPDAESVEPDTSMGLDDMFEVVRKAGEDYQSVQEKKEKIVLATVKGDIHDIGKNIVKVLLENYSFEVVDLGKDVPPETIVDTVVAQQIRLVGLSALMTTTVVSMEETIRQLREKAPWCKVMVGGAVLNQEYADMIGADFYGKDAMQSVYYAQGLLQQ